MELWIREMQPAVLASEQIIILKILLLTIRCRYQMVMTPITYTPENKNNYDNEALQNVTKEYSQLDVILSQSNTEPINFQIIHIYIYIYIDTHTVIPRLTKIIRSGITFVSRNLR